jgi:hypothetical protein
MLQPVLATRFSRRTAVLRSENPLAEDQMRAAAPSIFAESKHHSRSDRYTHIPTIDVLRGLRREGFEPFMVAQGKTRVADRVEHTKHMVRLRHAGQVQARTEANEIILINSHDGGTSYQMLAGVFRFVCCNGLVVGDIVQDLRIHHKGNVQDDVIDGAVRVLKDFETVDASVDGMKMLTLQPEEQIAFATAALTLRYGERTQAQPPIPVTADQLNTARRPEDFGNSLWNTLQRVQENSIRGGLEGRTTNGRRMRTREVTGIDSGVGLNRALWVLAQEMGKLKA